MTTNAKEVFIRFQNVQEIVLTLEQIKEVQDNLNTMFLNIENLKVQEEKILENWMLQLEELDEKVEYLAL